MASQEDVRLHCEELLAFRMSVNEEEAAAKRQDELHAAATRARPSASRVPAVGHRVTVRHESKCMPSSLTVVTKSILTVASAF